MYSTLYEKQVAGGAYATYIGMESITPIRTFWLPPGKCLFFNDRSNSSIEFYSTYQSIIAFYGHSVHLTFDRLDRERIMFNSVYFDGFLFDFWEIQKNNRRKRFRICRSIWMCRDSITWDLQRARFRWVCWNPIILDHQRARFRDFGLIWS